MGLAQGKEENWEEPSEKHHATLYYFAGRGLADQVRWMLAATEVSFTQKVISHRDQFVKMSQSQLPFGQLPLLQIDGLELVQSQAIVRYLARRAGIQGLTSDEVVKCDMIAESVKDLLSIVTSAPFKRVYLTAENGAPATSTTPAPSTTTESSSPRTASAAAANNGSSVHSVSSASTSSVVQVSSSLHALHDASAPGWVEHLQLMRTKFSFVSGRFEAILRSNRANLLANQHVFPDDHVHFLVGTRLTYADVLVAHVVTWYVEECGSDVVADRPMLVALQNAVISLPGVTRFIKSLHYFPLGDLVYVEQVRRVLARHI